MRINKINIYIKLWLFWSIILTLVILFFCSF